MWKWFRRKKKGSYCKGCGTQYSVEVSLCVYCGRAIMSKAKEKALRKKYIRPNAPKRIDRLIDLLSRKLRSYRSNLSQVQLNI